jgi:hypothetical protein
MTALFEMPDAIQRDAALSPDGLYRYYLSRRWGPGNPAVFVMLNPSTADAEQDDPTIRRCIGFARTWGHDGLFVVNLYALRSTDAAALWTADDPVGPDNDAWIRDIALAAQHVGAPVVAAWGAHARPDRVATVRALPGMHRLSGLALTKDGQPRHPLYLRSELRPVPLADLAAGGVS